jgi:hypothetical protein
MVTKSIGMYFLTWKVLYGVVTFTDAYLAYVEWFSPLFAPDLSHRMCQVSRQYGSHGHHSGSVIPLTDICQSLQLFPVFGTITPQLWQGLTVLEECQSFYVNPFLNKHLYKNFGAIGGRNSKNF